MFDDPKKELERLEQQLLAAEREETDDEDFDSLYEDIYEEFSEEESFDEDDELLLLLNHTDVPIRNHANNYGTDLYGRAAGFDADEEYYDMDEDRYVAAPKKKGIRGLLIIACLEAVAIIALAAWWLGRLL